MYDEHTIRNVQRSLNSGICWQIEGAAGREAMAYIKAGYCVLGPVATSRPYLDPVGSRTDVVRGTLGSLEYARERQPDFWEGRSDDWADNWTAGA